MGFGRMRRGSSGLEDGGIGPDRGRIHDRDQPDRFLGRTS